MQSPRLIDMVEDSLEGGAVEAALVEERTDRTIEATDKGGMGIVHWRTKKITFHIVIMQHT